MRFIHLICVGREDHRLHLAGLSRYTAHEVVLFNFGFDSATYELQERILDLGMIPRVVRIEDDYCDTFQKAHKEINGLLANGVCIALNISTGSRIVLAAIEDAIRIQLGSFHKENRFRVGPICTAFRYCIKDSRKRSIEICLMPLWNTGDSWHNVIISTLIDQDKYISIRQMWKILYQLEEYSISYEAFRKIFRGFCNWMKNLPCFKQKVERGQKFLLEL